jgi:glycosyltransferase involved in cell wall biosynthesis
VRQLPVGIRHLFYLFLLLKQARSTDLFLALDSVSVGLPVHVASCVTGKPYVVKVVGDYAWEQGRQRFGVQSTLDTFVRERKQHLIVQMFQAIQKHVAMHARHVIVPSKYLKEILVTWGVPTHKIEVIYNAIDVPGTGVVPISVAGLSQPRIVTVGRLVPWKGVHGVIETVANLRAEFPGLPLIVIGDGPERQRLEAHARELLADNVVFTGALSHDDTLAVLRSASVFVLNSTYEGLSHILIEALNEGVPIVATRVGGNPELITDKENGLLVPAGDSKELNQALRDILSDSGLAERLGRAAQNSSVRFTKERMITDTVNLVTTLV